jgi:hypothetical protein
MASTRNRNTTGDYQMEEFLSQRHVQFRTQHQSVGTIYLPGNGLIGQTCPNRILSHNATDIESELRGIGSTNLVKPKAPVHPECYYLKSVDICDRPEVVMPAPLHPLANQRPFPR